MIPFDQVVVRTQKVVLEDEDKDDISPSGRLGPDVQAENYLGGMGNEGVLLSFTQVYFWI